MENNLQYILIVLVAFLIVTIVMILLKNLRDSRYDEFKNKILMDDIRKSIESQIYSVNEKLLKNEEKWREMNHLLIRKEYLNYDSDLNLNSYNENIKINNFLKSNGINNEDLLVDKNLVFVLTPFHPDFDIDFNIIKTTCLDVGLKCLRGDEKYFSNEIFSEMLKYILKANLIIANINGRNPNVMYELGIAQSLDKPVILISKQPEDIPIDIRSKRFLIYRSYSELQDELKSELIRALTR